MCFYKLQATESWDYLVFRRNLCSPVENSFPMTVLVCKNKNACNSPWSRERNAFHVAFFFLLLNQRNKQTHIYIYVFMPTSHKIIGEKLL